jgi:1-deoxy-D-xylulose-5-phosphate synthase
MLYTAVKAGKPAAIRYPRGAGPGAQMPGTLKEIEIGKAELVHGTGEEPVCIWALGDMIPVALRAAGLLSEKKIAASVVNPRFIRPLDEDMLAGQVKHAKVLVTIENGVVKNGFGSLVTDAAVRHNFPGKILKCGWPDEFIPQGTPDILLQKYGLTARSVASGIEAALGK